MTATGSPGSDILRDATRTDAAAIAALYNPYILDTAVTFEETPVSADTMATRLDDTQRVGLPWLVLERDGCLLGYAYATPWKARSAYRCSVEVSVYVDRAAHGAGHGTQLFDALLRRVREAGMRAAIGGITLPNAASVALHEKFGFRHVGRFAQVGRKFDRWIDVGYWQRVFD